MEMCIDDILISVWILLQGLLTSFFLSAEITLLIPIKKNKLHAFFDVCSHSYVFSLADLFCLRVSVFSLPCTVCWCDYTGVWTWCWRKLHWHAGGFRISSLFPAIADLTRLWNQHLFLSKQRFCDASMCIRVRGITERDRCFSESTASISH